MSLKLSVTIITLNEEENIGACLDSIKDITDEIILVDSGSTDKTIDIAKKYGAKIYFRKLENFANQKNWALSKATGDWIFSIDADEIITTDLKKEIEEKIQDNSYDGYLIPRRNFILGKEIKHSRWSPDKHVWLWRRDRGEWEGEVHEEVRVNGRIGEIKNAKIHFQSKSVEDFINNLNSYSSLYAKKIFKEGRRFSFFSLLFDPIYEFNIRYIYKFGFFDGWRGFVLAYLMAFYQLSVWIKLYELQKTK